MRRLAVCSSLVALFACSSTRMPNERPAEVQQKAASVVASSSVSSAPATTTLAPPPAIAIEEPAHTRYPLGPIHSPMTKSVVARLSAVLAASPQQHDVVAKIGDSHTATPFFLSCVKGRDLRLGAHESLASTIALFRGWERESVAAKVGWHALDLYGHAIAGELAEARPAFAVVLVGTNDTHAAKIVELEKYLRKSVDQLLAAGTIPIVTTIPPRGDDAKAAALVPEINAAIRALAQSREVPLVDLQTSLLALSDGGLSADGIHLRAHDEGGLHPCWFDDASLDGGMNRRNLVTLEALDRIRRFVIEGEAPEHGAMIKPAEDGARFVDALPFADDGSIEEGATYAIDLERPMHLRARAFADDGVDAFVKIDDGPKVARLVELDVAAGHHRVVVVPRIGKQKPRAGAGWRVTIAAEETR